MSPFAAAIRCPQAPTASPNIRSGCRPGMERHFTGIDNRHIGSLPIVKMSLGVDSSILKVDAIIYIQSLVNLDAVHTAAVINEGAGNLGSFINVHVAAGDDTDRLFIRYIDFAEHYGGNSRDHVGKLEGYHFGPPFSSPG